MSSSSPQSWPRTRSYPESEANSQLSSLIIDLSQSIRAGMDNMLKMINDIDQNSAGIMEEIEKSKESVFRKKKSLEEERDHFQKAAYTVLNMLNTCDSNE